MGFDFRQEKKTFLSYTTCRLTLGVHPSSYLKCIRVFSRVKRPGHELDHLPNLMSNYEYTPLYLAHACVFVVWCLVEGGCYLALTFYSSL